MKITKTIVTWSTVVIASCFLGGCAAVVNGPTQEITFNSQPEGANVDFNGKVVGKTPLTMKLERKPLADSPDPKFTFTKDGYENVTIPITKKGCTGCVVGNGFLMVPTGILPGLTTTAIIEGSTGAYVEYSLNEYYALLLPKGDIVNISQPDTIKQYIVTNYGYLKRELEEKPGVYVDALLSLLNVPKDGKPQAIETLKKLSSTNKDVFKFADSVIEQFNIK